MAVLKKMLICPYFGELPEWFDKFEWPEGYDYILDTDLEGFKKRVRDKLGIEFPGTYGSPKVWDYRCALGLLYEEEIKGYDFWGHCDFDVVWGDIEAFMPDEFLNCLDWYSSHHQYICGCFSLYRNTPKVNKLFMEVVEWEEKMIYPQPNGWVENEYSRKMERSNLRFAYTFNQGWPWSIDQPQLEKRGKKLFQKINNEWHEIMLFHFKRFKQWPL
tara:strand:- start:656 stop:1303 length:648 start_codon:yes stop_codon:yes gene_type:complete